MNTNIEFVQNNQDLFIQNNYDIFIQYNKQMIVILNDIIEAKKIIKAPFRKDKKLLSDIKNVKL